jgi:hypothetical protein
MERNLDWIDPPFTPSLIDCSGRKANPHLVLDVFRTLRVFRDSSMANKAFESQFA